MEKFLDIKLVGLIKRINDEYRIDDSSSIKMKLFFKNSEYINIVKLGKKYGILFDDIIPAIRYHMKERKLPDDIIEKIITTIKDEYEAETTHEKIIKSLPNQSIESISHKTVSTSEITPLIAQPQKYTVQNYKLNEAARTSELPIERTQKYAAKKYVPSTSSYRDDTTKLYVEDITYDNIPNYYKYIKIKTDYQQRKMFNFPKYVLIGTNLVEFNDQIPVSTLTDENIIHKIDKITETITELEVADHHIIESAIQIKKRRIIICTLNITNEWIGYHKPYNHKYIYDIFYKAKYLISILYKYDLIFIQECSTELLFILQVYFKKKIFTHSLNSMKYISEGKTEIGRNKYNCVFYKIEHILKVSNPTSCYTFNDIKACKGHRTDFEINGEYMFPVINVHFDRKYAEEDFGTALIELIELNAAKFMLIGDFNGFEKLSHELKDIAYKYVNITEKKVLINPNYILNILETDMSNKNDGIIVFDNQTMLFGGVLMKKYLKYFNKLNNL